MATIIKNGKKWRAQVRRQGITKTATFTTRTEAVNWANFIEAEIEAGRYTNTPDVTFSALLMKYLQEVTCHKRGKREERFRILRIACTPLGEVKLNELAKEHFRAWQNQRLTEVQPASVARERATLSAVIAKAMEWDFLTTNPLKTLEKIKLPAARTRRYSEEEIEKIVYVSGYAEYSPLTTSQSRVGAAFLFALETAMRAGEIVNLTWNYVDLTKRTAHLPKTKNGHPRTVPLTKKAVEILKHLEQIKTDEQGKVFQVESRNLDAIFRKIKTQAGLADADLHFHDTRREALTRLAKKLSVMDLAKVSGHRDISILQNTYYAPDIAELAQKLD